MSKGFIERHLYQIVDALDFLKARPLARLPEVPSHWLIGRVLPAIGPGRNSA